MYASRDQHTTVCVVLCRQTACIFTASHVLLALCTSNGTKSTNIHLSAHDMTFIDDDDQFFTKDHVGIRTVMCLIGHWSMLVQCLFKITSQYHFSDSFIHQFSKQLANSHSVVQKHSNIVQPWRELVKPTN